MRRIAFLAVMLAPLLAQAGVERVGTTSAAFLKLGSGARAAAMGDAYVGLADDASGLAYNPAGMSQSLAGEIQATHTEWFRGLRYENLNGVFSLNNGGMIGATFDLLTVPRITRTEQIANTNDPTLNYREVGSFAPYDMQFGLAYSRPVMTNLLGGINFKVLSQSVDDRSSMGLGLDLGVLYLGPIKGLTVGFAAQNIGTPIKLRNEAFDLPLLLRLGGAYRTWNEKLLFTLETDMPTDNALVVAMGAELALGGSFYPRIGWRFNSIFNPWTVGFGIHLDPWILDLSAVPFGELGMTYRASLGWRFGKPGASLDARLPYVATLGLGKPAVLTPRMSAPDKVTSWGLYIYNGGRPAKVVRTITGSGPVSGELLWDGKAKDGTPLPEGSYWAVLSARYVTGQTVYSKYVRLEVNNSAPVVELSLDSASLNEKVAGEAYVPTGLRPQLKAGGNIVAWRMEILDPQGQVFRTVSGNSALPEMLVWDGKNDKGEALISGQVYSARLWVQDAQGNESSTTTPVSFKAVFH